VRQGSFESALGEPKHVQEVIFRPVARAHLLNHGNAALLLGFAIRVGFSVFAARLQPWFQHVIFSRVASLLKESLDSAKQQRNNGNAGRQCSKCGASKALINGGVVYELSRPRFAAQQSTHAVNSKAQAR
jgi:ribosomal protein S14